MLLTKTSTLRLILIALIVSPTAYSESQNIETLQLKSSRGDTQASLELGERFENGKGVEQNLGTALTYYNEASSRGNSEEARKLYIALKERYDEIEKKQKVATRKPNTTSEHFLLQILTMKRLFLDVMSQKPKIGFCALRKKDTAQHKKALLASMQGGS